MEDFGLAQLAFRAPPPASGAEGLVERPLPNRKARRQAARASARPGPAADGAVAVLFAEGLRFRGAGRTLEALDVFEHVLAQSPGHAGALYQLGVIAYVSGQGEQATSFFLRAAAADPEAAAPAIALGAVLHADGRLEAAAEWLEKALALTPEDAHTWMNLGNVRREERRFTDAEAALRRAVALAPTDALTWRNLAVTLQEQGDAKAAIACYDRALAVDPDFPEAQSGRLFCLNYDDDLSAETISEQHRRWGARVAARTLAIGRHWPNRPDPERGLRIGYVSGDFHTHPVGYFLAEVLSAHDRNGFEVFCYSNGRRNDAMTQRLSTASDHWRTIVDLTDAEAAALIRADGVDVLIDLSGHTAHGRLSLFAGRPAPVQAAWLGYVATTGLATIDYVLLDEETAPASSDGLFSETILRSSVGRFCYAPPEYAPSVCAPPSARGKPFTFGSFNDTLKLTPRVIRLWAEVLKAVPGSRLMLKWRSLDDVGVRRRLLDRFETAGIGAHRLDLRGQSPHAEMLAEYAEVDVGLDPLGFSGGMTTCEALWMGVPVVSLPEEKPASRQTLSFLARMDLTQLTAGTEAEYVSLAAALAQDPDRLAHLRTSLRPRMEASPLSRPTAFTAAHEVLLRRMWRTWCSRQPT